MECSYMWAQNIDKSWNSKTEGCFYLFIDADPMDCTNEWLFLIDGLDRHGII